MTAAVPTAHERLHAAWQDARAGRHEQALCEYVWFHEHALEEEPHLKGVRLSFALAQWKDLADVYPPALQALLRIRDRDMDDLLDGSRSWDLFHDVVSINERLGCGYETYELFVTLAEKDPAFAEECCSIALPSLIEARDFTLAARFLPDTESTIRQHAAYLNRRFAERRSRRFDLAPLFETLIDNYAELVKQHLAVLAGCGRARVAAALRRLAIDLIAATTLRRAVQAAMAANARPWYERGIPRKRRP